MIQAIEYFSVFGGLNIKLNLEKPIEQLIKESILNQYHELRNEINSFTTGYHVNHAILTAAAIGDRRTNSSFKKAHVSFEEGMKCLDNLVDLGIIELETSMHYLTNQRNDDTVSKKIIFTTPFFRFWFAFVSPIYKGIKDGNYEEFDTLFENYRNEFSNHIFEELCLEYLVEFYKEDELTKLGKYWDNNISIDLLAKTKSGKIIAGACKYSNSKIKKNELNKLVESCKKINLNVDILVIFAKTGYSNELKALKSDELKLFNAKSLKLLID